MFASPSALVDFGDDGQPHLDAGASSAMHGTGCVAITGPRSPTAAAAMHGVMLTTADVDMVRNRFEAHGAKTNSATGASACGIVGSVNVDALLQSIPTVAVYLIVGGVIGIESLGIPLPGEIALVSAALLASRHTLDISPVAVGAAATIGAVVGDTIGYLLGRRFGMRLFERMGKRFPKHFGPGHVALSKQLFARWGVWAVFFGRFIALLRILAGPLAGALHMRYRRFLAANAGGAVCWAGGTTAVVYYAGLAAEHWLSRFSWIALVVAVAGGIGLTWFLRERTADLIAQLEAEHDWETLRRSGRTR